MKEKTLLYKDAKVYYRVKGSGNALVFLHGYLESAEIWSSFTGPLEEDHRIICIDIPGHGRSGTWGEIHRMEDLAALVREVLNAEKVEKACLIGHSMGGYVVMAFAAHFMERLHGYVLFHSTCFADNAEKKANRDREISLVRCDKKRQIVSVNIPKAFADENVKSMPGAVSLARKIALATPDEGIIALLNGMKARRDLSGVLSDKSVPVLLIGGMKDNYISRDVFDKLVSMAPHADVVRLEESGHMGFLEQPEPARLALREFCRAHQ